jgi:murein DD-endopeptidase MepM/ murein hydrolase activator NlpD
MPMLGRCNPFPIPEIGLFLVMRKFFIPILSFLALVLGLAACNSSASLSEKGEGLATLPADTPEIQRIMDIPLTEIPLSPAFDFPVGPPDAKGYYNAQGFQKGTTHLGDDWNGVGGGNTDLGDPVYSMANGIVAEASDWGGGWGNVVRVLHNIGTDSMPEIVESFYAHLDQILVKERQVLKKGEQLGTIGTANGAYPAHLHLELRTLPGRELGGGYSDDTTGFTDPTAFIRAHRGN